MAAAFAAQELGAGAPSTRAAPAAAPGLAAEVAAGYLGATVDLGRAPHAAGHQAVQLHGAAPQAVPPFSPQSAHPAALRPPPGHQAAVPAAGSGDEATAAGSPAAAAHAAAATAARAPAAAAATGIATAAVTAVVVLKAP